jgi:hypothetical protein
MRKPGTQVPARCSACIPFGATKGQKFPKASVFSHQNSARATKSAARAGLMTLKVPPSVLPRLQDQLLEGDMNAERQLQLHPITDVLANLRVRYASQADKPAKGASGEPAGSPPKPPNSASSTPVAPKPPSEPPALDQLLAAFRLIDAAGVWLEKLWAELDDVFGQIGRGSAFAFLAEAGTTNFDHYASGGTWVLDGWRWVYPTKHRRRRIGELSIVADIGRPGRPAAVTGVPCVLVMWSSEAHDWGASVDTAKGFWPPHEATTTLVGGGCFRWTGKSAGGGGADMPPLRDGAWFYLVRLAALTNFAQLRKLVVQPALAMLNGTSPDEALASATGVMRFHMQGKEFVLDA